MKTIVYVEIVLTAIAIVATGLYAMHGDVPMTIGAGFFLRFLQTELHRDIRRLKGLE